MTEAKPWQRAYDVTLTQAEIVQIRRLARARRGGAPARYLAILLGGGVVLGFVSAALAVITRVVPPAGAAVIATGGTLACWAGSWLCWAAGHREADRTSAATWDAIGRHYVVTLNGDTLQWDLDGRQYRLCWRLFDPPEVFAGDLLLSVRAQIAVVLPARCLLPEWPAAAVASALNACIQQARSGLAGDTRA